jgi:hypothetical protein
LLVLVLGLLVLVLVLGVLKQWSLACMLLELVGALHHPSMATVEFGLWPDRKLQQLQ